MACSGTILTDDGGIPDGALRSIVLSNANRLLYPISKVLRYVSVHVSARGVRWVVRLDDRGHARSIHEAVKERVGPFRSLLAVGVLQIVNVDADDSLSISPALLDLVVDPLTAGCIRTDQDYDA